MNTLSTHLVHSAGWTLIHSIWQGIILYILLLLFQRAFPLHAVMRYRAAVITLLLMVVASVATFTLLFQSAPSDGQWITSSIAFESSGLVASSLHEKTILLSISSWIDSHIIWVMRMWMIGFVIFTLRFTSGLWYVQQLRKNATSVDARWTVLAKKLTRELHIKRQILIAQCEIASPIVIGYLKPVILFPIGLLSGLSPEQVEAILLHELSHVRRNDYLVNLLQSVTESFYFFNPFMWLISDAIRNERENCCDDVVIERGIPPLQYARTLTLLEARSSSQLALGIVKNQNQLLTRIKRMMEKSTRKDWSQMRLLPATLLLIGLICTIWLTFAPMQTNAATAAQENKLFLQQDTSIYVIEREVPESEIPEEIEAVAEAPFAEDYFPIPDVAPFPEPFQWIDSLPGGDFQRLNPNWETFEKEFTVRFSEEFRDFYQANQKKFDELMTEMKEMKMDDNEINMTVGQLRAIQKEFEQQRLSGLAPATMEFQKQSAMIALEDALRMQEAALVQEELARHHAARSHEETQAIMERMAQDQMRSIRAAESHEWLSAYDKEVKEEMIRDGYFKKSEMPDGLSVDVTNNSMVINGKKIKEAHLKKYKDMHRKYFERNRYTIPE